MGLFSGRWSADSYANSNNSVRENNPNPNNYKIKSYTENNGNLMIWINYPDCDNYEGDKICVYKGITLLDLIKQKLIDPHFSDTKDFKSPFMRLEPTQEGWNFGTKILSTI